MTTTMTSAPDQLNCDALRSPDPLTVFLAAFIFVGILVSYLPQHAKIINNRSSAGLSPWWVLLGGVSSIAALGTIMTLPQSRHDMQCCKELSGAECAAALLGVGQIGLQWGCFMFIVMLFLVYFPTGKQAEEAYSHTANLTHSPSAKRRDQVVVGSVTILTLMVIGATSTTLVVARPDRTLGWANFLGTVAGVLAMIQYIPQIYYTWRLGEIKSLSIITMLIQVPGAFLFAISLWLRVGWEGWSTWLMYVVTGILQAILLAMAISYWYAATEAKQSQSDDNHDTSNGSTPLTDDGGNAEPDTVASNERTALLIHGRNRDKKAYSGTTQRSSRPAAGSKQLSMLYAATPPDQDSDPSN